MSTTPEQIADLIAGYTDLKQYFENARNDIESDRLQLQQDVDSYIADAAAHMPVTPNLLADTKYFRNLCGGAINTETEVIAAHSNPWSAYWQNGTTGDGTAKVITLNDLEAESCPFGGDLALATNGPSGDRPFYGSGFRILVLDVTIASNQTSGSVGVLNVTNQGCSTWTGWSRGQFTVQSSVLFNLLGQSGDIRFHAQSSMSPTLIIDHRDAGQGWIFRQATRRGFGGCHQALFMGIGSMKVAMALPYVGFGDHGGRFVWAGSAGRYSHEDRVPAGFTY